MRAPTFFLLAILSFSVGCGIRSSGGFTVKLGITPLAGTVAPGQPAPPGDTPAELQDALITAHEVMRGRFKRLGAITPDFQRYYFDEWGDSTLDLKYVPKDSHLAVILAVSWYATDDERKKWKGLLEDLKARFEQQYGKERLGPLPWYY